MSHIPFSSLILTACNCIGVGSVDSNCDPSGVCTCNTGYTGNKCGQCTATYYRPSGNLCSGR